MGWDAYVVTSREAWDTGQERQNAALRTVFDKVNAELVRRTGRGGQIWNVMLGGSSEPFLQCATPIPCVDDSEEGLLFWPTETVKQAHIKADWDFAREGRFRSICNSLYQDPLPDDLFDLYYDADDFQSEKWEVRLFLESCAENDFAIVFTW